MKEAIVKACCFERDINFEYYHSIVEEAVRCIVLADPTLSANEVSLRFAQISIEDMALSDLPDFCLIDPIFQGGATLYMKGPTSFLKSVFSFLLYSNETSDFNLKLWLAIELSCVFNVKAYLLAGICKVSPLILVKALKKTEHLEGRQVVQFLVKIGVHELDFNVNPLLIAARSLESHPKAFLTLLRLQRGVAHEYWPPINFAPYLASTEAPAVATALIDNSRPELMNYRRVHHQDEWTPLMISVLQVFRCKSWPDAKVTVRHVVIPLMQAGAIMEPDPFDDVLFVLKLVLLDSQTFVDLVLESRSANYDVWNGSNVGLHLQRVFRQFDLQLYFLERFPCLEKHLRKLFRFFLTFGESSTIDLCLKVISKNLPRSLVIQCRRAIHQTLPKGRTVRLQSIDSLLLPETLSNILKFSSEIEIFRSTELS